MARIINILPESLVNKIAAGEVVQRPASVIKELLENSLDAGATALTVVIKEGGKTFMQVADDGGGMSDEDAVLAFDRHATSKITTYEDLENIRTLGFRGEALASIAAVSHVELHTRKRDEGLGFRVRIEGGEIRNKGQDSHQPGTSVTVKNLFYNTPGRRNFLKTNNTEFKHVFDVVLRAAISHPDRKITFVSDDETVLDLHPTTRDNRIRDVFGDRQTEGLVAIGDSNEHMSIVGYASKPNYSRRTRVEQYLFLNGRYIVNRSLNHAVFQAYEHLLEKGSFPFFVILLTIDPHRVDVNVHPSKMEVKFDDEGSVYRFVVNAVRKSLLAQDLAPFVEERMTSSGPRGGEGGWNAGNSWERLLRPGQSVDTETGEIGIARPMGHPGGSTSAFSSLPFGNVWQIHNKYIVTPTTEGLMVVDQHVAHERVLYERIVDRLAGRVPPGQQLLFSHTIGLTPGDAALVAQLHPDLTAMGFELKFFGRTTVALDAVPQDVKPGEETTILQQLIDLYKENEHTVSLEPRENLAKSFSCRAAVKAGDPLNADEMRSLLEQLFATKNPFVCPHGRPVIVKLTLAELDKRFGRPA